MPIQRGRAMKRQMCILPGGTPVVLTVKSASVVQEAIDQVCSTLDVNDTMERDEYTLFYVIETGELL